MKEKVIEMEKMLQNTKNHVQSTNEDFKTTLLDNVLLNATDEIENTVNNYLKAPQQSLNLLLNYRYKNCNEKTIVIIACIDERVSSDTLNKLCSILIKYGEIDYIDDMWHGWELLHYVARTANVKKLEVIIKYLPKQSINVLTNFSENALHVLLQYEQSITPIDVVLYNGMESKCSKIIGLETESIVECAKLLIRSGIDVNHTNFWNETPICLAARYRFLEVIKNLIKVDYIDIETCFEAGQNIREYIKSNLYINLPKSYVLEDPLRIKFNYLKSNDMEKFFNYTSDNIRDNINCFDGENEFNSCGTMLHLCVRKGYFEFLQNKGSKLQRLTNYDIKNTPMLKFFQYKGFSRYIIYLLDNGADPSITSRKFPVTLLEYSALRGYYPMIAILLQHRYSKIHSENIFAVISKLYKTKLTFDNQSFYRNCVLYLLINRLLFLFRQHKENLTKKKLSILNKTLLHLNLENSDRRPDDSELICQILHLGASLNAQYSESEQQEYQRKNLNVQSSKSAQHDYQKEVLNAEHSKSEQEDYQNENSLTEDDNNNEINKRVIERLDPNILRLHLDDCIYRTTFKYDSLIQDDNESYSENRSLHAMVNDKHKRIFLSHPIIIELIRRKWHKVRWVFYADITFFAILLLSIYVYMISSHADPFVSEFNVFFYFLLIFHMVKEGLQFFFLYRLKYFADPSNILELSIIICCLITIAIPNVYTSVLSLLLGTVIFFVLLGQLPGFSKYTIIFSSISYFLEYTGFYFMQFVSFALCFHLLFPFDDQSANTTVNNSSVSNEEASQWGNMFKGLFYTLIYFTGEFSERVLEPTQYPVFGRIITTIFIFSMTIILNNLLVGLIVADMDDIQKSGRLYKQVKLASFIQSTSTFVKRLHRFKHIHFVESVINQLNIFKPGKRKIIKDVDFNKFDDENKIYLREISKVQIFDRHVLSDVYESIKKSNDT